MFNVLKKLGLVILLIAPACLYLYIVSPDEPSEKPTSNTATQVSEPSTPDH